MRRKVASPIARHSCRITRGTVRLFLSNREGKVILASIHQRMTTLGRQRYEPYRYQSPEARLEEIICPMKPMT